MKNNKILFTVALILVMTLSVATFISCGQKIPDKSNDVSGEYWSLDYVTASWGEAHLKKVCFNENGDVTSVYNFNFNTPTREIFYYNNGKLDYSETFEIFHPTRFFTDSRISDVKLYETRYVYEGDKIVKGEVFFNDSPTRSYDEYEYTGDGKLKTVKRYELGKLSETYEYNGKNRPESIQYSDFTFVPDYDKNGNVIKAQTYLSASETKDGDITVEYSNGFPSKTIRSYTSNSEKKELLYKYHSNGNISQIKQTAPASAVYEYNEAGRIICFTREDKTVEISYNENGSVTEFRNLSSNGDELSFLVEYDANGLATKKIYRDKTRHPYSWYEFDANGKVTKHTESYDGQEFGSTYEYYSNGVIKTRSETSIHTPSVIVTTYAENGYRILSKVSDNEYTEYLQSDICYDFSRSITATQLESGAIGSLITKSVNPNGEILENKYNENYIKIKSIVRRSDGSMLINEYDENGTLIKGTEYDNNGNIIN